MLYLGEIIALTVAGLWTVTALSAEIAGKGIGAVQLNVFRMVLSIAMLSGILWWSTGTPYPTHTNGEVWFWLSLSGFVGYLLGDFCLFNAYIIIGSRYGQLFMTLAPPAAALSGWIILGEQLSPKAILGMVVTLSGIALSLLKRGEKHKVGLKLPMKGILFGIGAGVGQGLGLVISKVGLNHYADAMPSVGADQAVAMIPFAATYMRAITGAIGFTAIILWRKQGRTLVDALHDKRSMLATLLTTFTGPVIGVSLSLMAVQYTESGIASTLMALTPILILWPAYLLFKQRVTPIEIVGTVVSVIGVSLFFI